MRRVLLLALVLLLASCGADTPAADASAPLTIGTSHGDVTLQVEIADDAGERAEGLSGRTTLGTDSGMAFVWPEPVQTSFWMKDTLIPLQIAFWDAEGRVVAIVDMEPCEADPCPTYGPDGPFLGAAEANAGWFTDHGVREGDTVDLGGIDA